jgi:Tol biopolymer transport system component
MVYRQRKTGDSAIWRIPGPGGSASDPEPKKLIASSGEELFYAYSPDGRRIAFLSTRGGGQNIWVCESDGSNAVQLTNFDHTAGTPRWSPDGRRIVFDSSEAGDWNLYIVDAEGGAPRRLTQEPSDEIIGTWSHDGKWIYFNSDRSGESQIWKIPAEGGAAVQVTRGGGFYTPESADGSYLYYAKSESGTGIWRVPVGGGEETEVFSGPIGAKEWTLSGSGIYYATHTVHGRWCENAILHLDFESGQVTEVIREEGPVWVSEPKVSPDQEWILYNREVFGSSELMLMENFR